MPHKPGERNCLKERYHNPNIKPRCGECQSCKDQKISNEIHTAHIPGKFCKKSNLCDKCSQVKYLVRAIRHACGCECTRKCELCKGTSRAAEVFMMHLNHHFMVLHWLMLPHVEKIRPKKPRPSWMNKRAP